jgi:hypothetical protein
MPRRKPAVAAPVRKVIAAVEEALELLAGYSLPQGRAIAVEQPDSLLDQCLELCAQRDASPPEPVRTLHHFASSGGTMITKCLAAMPNTQVLSEIDPLSTLAIAPGQPRFSPSDMILAMRQSTRGVSDELIARLFLQNLELIYEETKRVGQRLLIRDHVHSHYCVGPNIPKRPGLRDLVSSRLPTVSAVTVRHPLDSYVSTKELGWLLSYSPSGLDEYCRRYLVFLADHGDLPVVRYEDILEAPERRISELCDHLLLPFRDDFAKLFDVFRLTGDSGRSGKTIQPRPRRPIGDGLAREASDSANYRRLCAQLQYAR